MPGESNWSHPVRQAFWLMVAAVALLLTNAVVVGGTLSAFDANVASVSWDESYAYDDLPGAKSLLGVQLVVALVLAAACALGAAVAARRSTLSRTLLGLVVTLAGTTLVLGLLFGPESVLDGAGGSDQAAIDVVLPPWLPVLSSVVTGGTILFGFLAMWRTRRPRARDYYEEVDPGAPLGGFLTWLTVAGGGRLD